jgi:hypothetical protein
MYKTDRFGLGFWVVGFGFWVVGCGHGLFLRFTIYLSPFVLQVDSFIQRLKKKRDDIPQP